MEPAALAPRIGPKEATPRCGWAHRRTFCCHMSPRMPKIKQACLWGTSGWFASLCATGMHPGMSQGGASLSPVGCSEPRLGLTRDLLLSWSYRPRYCKASFPIRTLKNRISFQNCISKLFYQPRRALSDCISTMTTRTFEAVTQWQPCLFLNLYSKPRKGKELCLSSL